MNQFPDDLFQIFLEYNGSKEIFNILCMVEKDKDYRLKKYVYYISNEIKNRSMTEVLEKRKKEKTQSINGRHIIYENILSDISDINKNVSYNLSDDLFTQTNLDDFYKNHLL